MILVAGVLVSTPASATANETPWEASADGLRVVESTDSNSIAKFGYSTTEITITSERQTDSRATASVTLDNKEFTVDRDLTAGEANWSGNDATLTPDDLRALTQLSNELSARWLSPAREGSKDLSQHRQLSARLVMLLAEAPPGVALGEQTTQKPSARHETKADRAHGVELRHDETNREPCTTAADGTGVAACQVDDDEGIFYMSCVEAGRFLSHDAENHCFTSEVINSGPGSSGCMGECGPGCNGIGTYTYDCGDHDRCGRVHGGSLNPWDGDCGDEYWDADDDFLWAEINRC